MAMARRTSALLAVVLLCAACVAPTAHAGLVKATAATCADFAVAATSLKQAYEAATTSAPVTLKLELACTGSFVCTNSSELFKLSLNNATTKNGKQPAITIDISANPKCRKGDSRPLIDGSVLSRFDNVFSANGTDYPDTPLTFKLSSVRAVGESGLLFVRGRYTTKTMVIVRDVGTIGMRIIGEGETVQMTGGSVVNVTGATPAFEAVVTKSAKLERVVMADNSIAVKLATYVPSGSQLRTPIQFTVTHNTFRANGFNALLDDFVPVFLSFSTRDTASATIQRNEFIGNAGPTVFNQTVCVSSKFPPLRKRLSLAGNKGVTPTKPAPNKLEPWPTSPTCDLGLLTQA